ncbi:MAG TPA: sulfotransferase [Thermomonas sp.]|nr:sulfotransferase [Thermomonas sp.]
MQQHSRFMIACAARTGSTMLVRTLRSHPRLIVHGEVWGDRMVGVDGPLGRACEADPTLHASLEAMRFEQPERVLRESFLDAHAAQAAGFKLKYDELVRPQWREVRRLVEADSDLAIVFLHRRDLLRRYLSHQVVLRQTGITVVAAGGTPPPVAPFAVDIDDLLRDIAETRRRTREFEAAFAAHPSLHVAYEDLAADPQAQCDRVFGFLGVEPAPVRVATEKIVRVAPEALVLNHAEVQAALQAAGEA